MADSNDEIRENGIHYTPGPLASFLVKQVITDERQTILDPSYGDGALLLAAERYSQQLNRRPRLELYGCDILPLNGLLNHIPKANLLQCDFFNYDSQATFDVVVSNPPFVRHQNQRKSEIMVYREQFPDLQMLDAKADLWAYFLIKSVNHVRVGGSLAAILPWSFIQADYSQRLRQWLAQRFGKIQVLALTKQYFRTAQERIVLLVMKDRGGRCKKLSIGFARDYNDPVKSRLVKRSEWGGARLSPVARDRVDSILSGLLNDHSFAPIHEHARIQIGVVTGANKFFVRSRDCCSEIGIPPNAQVPILTSATDLGELLRNGPSKLDRLILLKPSDASRHVDLLKEGIRLGVNLRSHSVMREHWFSIKTGFTPDAFFPYRVSKTPYVVLNSSGIQSTNSVHRIYFKKLSVTEQKWFVISLLSVYGQLSLTANAKNYGRGMTKIEPGALSNSLVRVSNDRRIEKTYSRVVELLANDLKDEAMKESSDFVNNACGIPKKLYINAQKCLESMVSHNGIHG